VTRWRTRTGLTALVALGGLALGACGVPIGGTPTVIANRLVNPGALAPPPTTLPEGTSVYIYLIDASGTPTPFVRQVPPAQCTNLETLLQRLVAGPDSKEQGDGFFSAIPGGTEVLSVTPRSVPTKPLTGPITVDFNQSFGEVAGAEQVLAVEQIVYTVNQLDAGAPLLFEIEGQPTEVPVATGAQVARAVSSLDYPGVTPVSTSC